VVVAWVPGDDEGEKDKKIKKKWRKKEI